MIKYSIFCIYILFFHFRFHKAFTLNIPILQFKKNFYPQATNFNLLRCTNAKDILNDKLQRIPNDIIKSIETTTLINGKKEVTIADVSMSTGRDLINVRKNIMLLATLTQADLKVTNDGDIIYAFPNDIQGILLRNSIRARVFKLFDTISPIFYSAFKISFGVALIVSLTIIFVSLEALLSSTSSKDSDKDSNSNRSSYRSGSFVSSLFDSMRFTGNTMNFFVQPYSPNTYYSNLEKVGNYEENLLDIYASNRKKSIYQHRSNSILESFYSYLFGDGDPNEGFEKAQVIAVSRRIRQLGGVIAAEDISSYLSPPLSYDTTSTVVDESWILPIIIKLGGEPIVTPDKENICYVFQDVILTTSTEDSKLSYPPYLEELEIPFSVERSANLQLAGFLGIVNLIGALVLGNKLTSTAVLSIANPLLIAKISKVFPFLLAFATLYNVIPLTRFINNSWKNRDIRQRNTIRKILSSPKTLISNEKTMKKLSSIRSFASSIIPKLRKIKNDNIIIDTSQLNLESIMQKDLEDFDKKLNQYR